MTNPVNLPKVALEDPFGPPENACEVRCLHCGQKYSSSRIVWNPDRGPDGLWSCPVPECDGAGFGFDIHPIDSGLWHGGGAD